MRLTEIERGTRGQEVQYLQHLLNTTDRPRPPLELDGKFGPMTERAVLAYQDRHKLEVDGVVGAETWRSLGATGASLPPPSSTARAASAGRSVGGQATRAVTAPSIRQLPVGGASTGRGIASAATAVTAPASRVALKPAAARPAARRSPPLSPPGTAIGAPWMTVAEAEKGIAQIVGAKHNRRIIEYHATTSLSANTDEVAWCASFVNWCLKQVNIRGTNNAGAASFATWGQKLETGRYGCIVQLHNPKAVRRADGRTGSRSGNHVGFFVSQTATHITLLGGNQGRQVKLSSFPLSTYQVKAMRWPN